MEKTPIIPRLVSCYYTLLDALKIKDRQFDNFVVIDVKLSLQLPVPPVSTKLSNWRPFGFSDVLIGTIFVCMYYVTVVQ